MTTKYSPPDGRPKKWDIAVVIIVLLLSGAVALGFYGPKLHQEDGLSAVISIGGEVTERIDLHRLDGETHLTVEGECTLEVLLSADGAAVTASDCPTQDCVHTGHISRPGQSIVCLPGQVVIHLEGASSDDAPDIVVG
ncbi:MAG: NusG domain II-containing protein [Oscillospiraceae bacterium]|nr:NusG domain II-containing protein [Oscillospiraceae bacterium]